jgi:hypothetical protein
VENSLKQYLKRFLGVAKPEQPVKPLPAEDLVLLERIRGRNLTYLSDVKLAAILSTCRLIEDAGLPGVFMEAGCALGGSSILISRTKSSDRPFFVYDVFGMIPPPGKEDTDDVHERYRQIVQGKSSGIGGDQYYGYRDDLYELVLTNLREFGVDCERQSVHLIKGLLQETMVIDQPVAFAHVDVDWYDPVMTCMQRVFPRLVVGGSVILDDYHDWGGCRKAVDEYLRDVTGQFELDDSARSLKVTRIRPRQ